MNIEAAVKYPFSKSNWQKPFLIMFGLYFIFLGLPSLIRFPGTLATIFSNDSAFEGPATGIYLITTSVALILSLTSIPFSFYISGYLLRLFNAVRNDEALVPEHKNIGETFVDGLKLFVINFVYAGVPALVFVAFLAISMISFGVGLGIGEDASIGFGVLGGVISGFLAFLSFIALVLVGILVVPAVNYEFTSKGNSFNAAFDLERIKEVIRVGAKDFFIVWLVAIGMGMALAFVVFFGFCISFLVQPAVQTYALFLSGSLYGTVFKELDMKLNPAKAAVSKPVKVSSPTKSKK